MTDDALPPPPPSYPVGAYPTGGVPPQPPAPQKPGSVALAVKLMLVGAGLSILSLLYSLTTIGGLKDDLREQLVSSDAAVDQATIDVAYGVAIAFVVLFGLVGAVLWAWMAWKNGQGRSWARVMATVFAGLNLLGLLFTGAGPAVDTISLVLSVLSVVLAAVIVVMLWRKESSEFFTASEASRRLY